MCGLMLLVGPVPEDVSAAAVWGAAARGPHSSGYAHWNGDGWEVERYIGRVVGAPRLRPLIGHFRLATSGRLPGDAPPADEAQPYSDGHLVIAHNGTIPLEVQAAYLPRPLPAVDSMALLRALDACFLPSEVLAGCPAPQAVLWARERSIWAYRHAGDRAPAHPLYLARGDGWVACSSAPLPEGRLIPEEEPVEVWT